MEVIYSDEIPHGIRMEVDGVLVVGTNIKGEKDFVTLYAG